MNLYLRKVVHTQGHDNRGGPARRVYRIDKVAPETLAGNYIEAYDARSALLASLIRGSVASVRLW
jgi:hypothetical protein